MAHEFDVMNALKAGKNNISYNNQLIIQWLKSKNRTNPDYEEVYRKNLLVNSDISHIKRIILDPHLVMHIRYLMDGGEFLKCSEKKVTRKWIFIDSKVPVLCWSKTKFDFNKRKQFKNQFKFINLYSIYRLTITSEDEMVSYLKTYERDMLSSILSVNPNKAGDHKHKDLFKKKEPVYIITIYSFENQSVKLATPNKEKGDKFYKLLYKIVKIVHLSIPFIENHNQHYEHSKMTNPQGELHTPNIKFLFSSGK